MNMTVLTLVLAIAVFLLYAKWILFVIIYFAKLLEIPKKKSRNAFSLALAAPNYLIESALRGGGERCLVILTSRIPSHNIRKLIYKTLGAKIGKRVVFHYGTEIRKFNGLEIGEGTIIGDNSVLDARNGLTIGSNVNLSSYVSIWTNQHDYRDPDFAEFSPKSRKMSVIVGDRAWLGSHITVLPGVTIGEGAVCCAGCVVTKDVPPYTVVAGVPAKEIARRPQTMKYEFEGKSCRLY